jgi:hypothetical protein
MATLDLNDVRPKEIFTDVRPNEDSFLPEASRALGAPSGPV